ncbi:MAG: DUF2339 domain-containing protein [Acidobacteria bacterium]|nr:DUF2339 domain-containing protein [Acidobacteriota bacterium]
MPETDEPRPQSPPSSSPPDREEGSALAQRVAWLEERIQALETALGAASEPERNQPTEQPLSPSPLDLEARLAGSFLNYVGLLALLLGLALLIGYWMESHATQALLLALLSAATLAALAGSIRGRASRTLSFTLEGGALGLVLVAGYLSFRWLGLPLSLLLAAAISLFAMRRALLRDSQLVASFALLAALLGPLLLRSAQSGEGFLFGYLAVVNAGAVWTGRRKGWIPLRYLALTGSHLAAWFWYLNHPGANLALTAAFPLLTFGLFAWVVPAGKINFAEGLLGVLNSGGLLAATFSILHQQSPDLASWVPLALGGLHAGIASLCWRNQSLREHFQLHGWIAGCLIAVGLVIPLSAAPIAIGWTAEGFVLGWLGVRWHRGWLRGAANLLGISAALTILLGRPSPETLPSLIELLAPIAVVACVIVLNRMQRQTEPGAWEWALRWLLAILAVALPMLVLGGPIISASAGPFALAPQLLTSAFWASYSAALCLIGWFTFSPFLRWMGVGLLLMTAVKVFLVDPVSLSPASRIGSFLLLAVFLLLLSYLFQTRRR